MQPINVSNVLNKLKSLSHKTDILIYDYNNEQDKIKNWVSTIKETVDSIVNDSCHDISDNSKENSKSADKTICIPDLVKLLKDDNNVNDKHRISTWLAEVQKDHVKHNRKSRHSLRKIVLGKKSNNRWVISKAETDESCSKSSSSTGKLKQDQKTSLSKSNTSFAEESLTPKLVTSVSTLQHSIKKISVSEQNVLTGEVKPDSFDKEDSHFTPVQSSEILAPNTCETPTINSKKPCYNRTHVVKSKKLLSVMKNELEYKESTPVVCNTGSTSSDKFVTPENKMDTFHTPSDQTVIIDSAASADIQKVPSNRVKRKSSIQLTRDNLKKAKSSKKESQEVKSVTKVCDNSIKHPRRGKPANTSAVIQAKTSAIMSQQTAVDNEKRILREIQKKEEIISQNTQKIKSLRQQKIEENKKTREMKMEKAMQQRMKIVKEKEERLRCRTLSKQQQENVQQKGSAQKKAHAKRGQNKGETSSARKVETPTPSKKASASPTKGAIKQNGSHSTKKAPPKPVRTPAKKPRVSPKEQAQENQTSKADQTFSMTGSKVTPTQEKDVFAKPALNSTYVGSPKPVKVLATTPTAKKTESKVKAVKTPHNDPSKKLNSYAVTPSESSFVSYDVSEIKSDDDDDEEEEEVNHKPIPNWATGVQLRSTLVNQHYNSGNIDTDKLFGNYFETPNLEAIMGVQKKHYFKRTSSAIWLNSPNRSILS